MRFLILFVMLALAQETCHPQATDVKIVKATSQQWMGGAVGSGRGIIHRVSFLIKKPGWFVARFIMGKWQAGESGI